MNLQDFANEVHNNAVEHGWWEGERDDAEVIALIHSKWSKALEAYRNGEGMYWQSCQMERRPVTPMCERRLCPYHQSDKPTGHWVDGRCEVMKDKPEGIAAELIDGVILLLDAAAAWGVELPNKEMEPFPDIRKYNLPRLVTDLHARTARILYAYRPAILFQLIIEEVWSWLQFRDIDPEMVLNEEHKYNLSRHCVNGEKV